MNFWKKARGFTLIELLVVISIIGILTAIGMAAFSVAQKKGRDAKRVGDLKAMQQAIEQYRANNNSYTNVGDCSSMILQGGMSAVPLDPRYPTHTYTTNQCSSMQTYCICAYMEGGQGNNNWYDCSLPVSTSEGDFFCVQALQ